MNFLQSDKKTIVIIFAIYLVTNITFLLNYNAIYWDDWSLYGQSFETIENMFIQAVGNSGYAASVLHYTLLHLGNGVIGYRILSIALLFLSGIFVYKILQTLDSFSKEDRFFVTLFFLLAPLYSAKIALINFPYTFYSTFFFFAFYLVSKYINTLGVFKRVFILFLFFTSFLISSIVVFYAIALLYIFFKLYDTQSTFLKNFIVFIQTKLDFILLPIVFYIIKSIYFVPSGAYEGYNSIKITNLILSPLYFFKALHLNFSEPILEAVKLSIPLLPIFLLLLIFSSKHSKKDIELEQERKLFLNKKYLLLGFVFFFFGSFAYLAVSKMPSLYDWDSRFQLLLPLGFSFILYFGISSLANIFNVKETATFTLLLFFALSFSLFHINDGVEYNRDWLYQQSIAENIKNSEIIKSHNTFIINTMLNNKLAKNRTLRFYELNGISKDALGKDDKFFILRQEDLNEYKKYKQYQEYNFFSWKETQPITLYLKENPQNILNQNQYFKSIKYLLKLRYLEYFNHQEFKKEIINIVSFENA